VHDKKSRGKMGSYPRIQLNFYATCSGNVTKFAEGLLNNIP